MDKASWMEVSFEVSPEQAEAVAEILGRFTQEGVVIEQLAEDNSPSPELILKSFVKVFGYIFMDASLEEQKLRLERSIFYLSKIQPIPEPVYTHIYDQDWMAAWKQHYRPLKIGKKMAILPAWVENAFPSRIPIRINPGMAFGTGTHPTTQLCLLLLEKHIQPGQSVFDIGCGSGILSTAALKLGADKVFSVDVSSAAIASSAENAELNQVQDQIELHQGSVTEILNGCFTVKKAPLVLANILTPIILKLFEDGMAKLIEPGGKLILSGILSPQADQVIEKAQSYKLAFIEKQEIDDWVALSFINN
jgi:ribosomal protein L11 methyltransferase